MNPEYDNRTYYFNDGEYIKKIFSDLVDSGARIRGTREFCNARLVIPYLHGAHYKFFTDAGADTKQVLGLVKAISKQDENYITEIYDSKHYTFLLEEVKRAFNQFFEDGHQTRRAVISFPASHCFDSVQILLRDASISITVNMRSCNAYKNLINDLFLIFILVDSAITQVTRSKETYSMVVNIGSLHLFEEDVLNVLRNA